MLGEEISERISTLVVVRFSGIFGKSSVSLALIRRRNELDMKCFPLDKWKEKILLWKTSLENII